jgi:hypothetical protein
MHTHFSTDRHAGAFAFALFGLCALQSVLLLGYTGSSQAAALIPPALREEQPNIERVIRSKVQNDRRTRDEAMRERMRRINEAAAQTEDQEDTTSTNTACAAIETLRMHLQCASAE